MYEICLRFVWDLFQICLRLAWALHENCMKFTWDFYEICISMRFAWDLREICMKFVWDLHKICRKKAWNKLFADLIVVHSKLLFIIYDEDKYNESWNEQYWCCTLVLLLDALLSWGNIFHQVSHQLRYVSVDITPSLEIIEVSRNISSSYYTYTQNCFAYI